jgi:(p)ppGpp synthase/HD superfamily hydrolase
VNIEGGSIVKSGENRAIQTFDLAVRDRKHLETVVRNISKLKGVLSVERVRQ